LSKPLSWDRGCDHLGGSFEGSFGGVATGGPMLEVLGREVCVWGRAGEVGGVGGRAEFHHRVATWEGVGSWVECMMVLWLWLWTWCCL
jgi:hypothetical protein